MKVKRKIIRRDTPSAQPGFLGPGHMARPLLDGDYAHSDPFILLMDDMLDKKDTNPVGGPHPHAGFETVSLLLEGEIGDEKHTMKAGDFQLMTAGSGIIHTETIDKIARMRLLQLWVNLSKKKRTAEPRLQDLSYKSVPHFSKDGISVYLYSGLFAGMQSPVLNHTPMIIADITIAAGHSTIQTLPANYNTFVYVLKGKLIAGDDKKELSEDEVGWLDLPGTEEQSELRLEASEEEVRFVLYAGLPTREKIVSHGPFIADSTDAIRQMYHKYNQGAMKHVSTLAAEQQFKY